MRILFCGDIVGRPGRTAVTRSVPELRDRLRLDFVIANGENAAGGFGITESICQELFDAGVDAITGGNHMWDQREAIRFIDGEPRLIRPLNYPDGTPGRGSGVFTAPKGRKVVVISVMARLYMDALDDPFAAVERELSRHRLGASAHAIVLDVHGEATSEKMAMGHFVDGRVSLCVGTMAWALAPRRCRLSSRSTAAKGSSSASMNKRAITLITSTFRPCGAEKTPEPRPGVPAG